MNEFFLTLTESYNCKLVFQLATKGVFFSKLQFIYIISVMSLGSVDLPLLCGLVYFLSVTDYQLTSDYP